MTHPGARVWFDWTVATVVALFVARVTRIGPAWHLSVRHGIHAGDVAAFVVAYAWAAWVTTGRRRAS